MVKNILGNLYPNRGVKGPFLGYFWKNGPVQENINPSIYIIDLTPLVYKNPTFYRSNFFNDLERKLLITEID